MKIVLTPVETQKLKDENDKTEQSNKICPFCKEDTYVDKRVLPTKVKMSIFKKYDECYYTYECRKCGGKWIGDPIYSRGD